MVKVLQFYLDDSGTRRPDRKPGNRPKHGCDYFALGGILIKESDEPEARQHHAKFVSEWGLKSPLHSVEIRGRNGGFLWLQEATESKRAEFLESLYRLMRAIPAVGLACVIDRPGYNHRYSQRYGDRRWMLCKTAFSVAVERAAKYAISIDHRLRVLPEKCNSKDDSALKGYYTDLRSTGLPFAIVSPGVV